MAIIASNDDAKKAQQIQTEKKNEADLDRKEVGEMMPSLTVELTRNLFHIYRLISQRTSPLERTKENFSG